MTNQPISMWGNREVFRETPFGVTIIFLEGSEIPSVVTVVMAYNGVFQDDVSIPVVLTPESAKFELTVDQLRDAAAQRKPSIYVKFGNDIRLGNALNITMNTGVYDPDETVSVNITGEVVLRISVASDYIEIREQANRAEFQADRVQEYVDLLLSAESNGVRRLGIWDASTNTPTLSTTVPPSGNYYDVANTATSSGPTGSPVLYTEGQIIISTGLAWEIRPGSFIPADGSVTEAKLNPRMQALNGELAPDSEYAFVLEDSEGRIGLAIRKNGELIGKFALQNEAVTFSSLAPEVSKLVFHETDDSNSEFKIQIVDSVGRRAWGITHAGKVIQNIELTDGSVTEEKLSEEVLELFPTDQFTKLNDTNPNIIEIEDTDLLRGNRVEIPVKTFPNAGYVYSRFPNVKTKVLSGLNDTGTALLFRQCSMPIRGRYHRGDFDPTASGIVGTRLVGFYGNNYLNQDLYPAFPSGATGDCWSIHTGNGTGTKTKHGLTFKNGDLLVKTIGGHAIQPGPGNGSHSDVMGEFWNVTVSGIFGGKYYTAGQRIYLTGLQSESGPKYLLYAPSKPGELYICGECDGSFAPVSPLEFDAYVFSTASTAQGIAGQVGDILVYRGGWGLHVGQLHEVANNKSYHLPCQNANEWAVRRADKSATEVDVKAFGHVSYLRKKRKNELYLYSDSMFGFSNVGGKVINNLGLPGGYSSFGGGTSRDILGVIKHDIASGDPHAGKIQIVWHGTNNISDLVQIKSVAWEIAALTGAVEKRLLFWTPIPSRSVTWNGTRFVCATQEAAFGGSPSGNEYAVEQMYATSFPKQFFNCRAALLEAAALRNVTDLQFPSMTEAQVAATYGIIPLSFWFEFQGKPFTQAGLNYQGTRSTAGLPSGGADNNYFLRINNGTIGNLIVRSGGVWAEYTPDYTHLSEFGATIIAAKFTEFYNSLNI